MQKHISTLIIIKLQSGPMVKRNLEFSYNIRMFPNLPLWLWISILSVRNYSNPVWLLADDYMLEFLIESKFCECFESYVCNSSISYFYFMLICYFLIPNLLKW